MSTKKQEVKDAIKLDDEKKPTPGQTPTPKRSLFPKLNSESSSLTRPFKKPKLKALAEEDHDLSEDLTDTQENMEPSFDDEEFEETVRKEIVDQVRKWIDLHAESVVRLETKKFLSAKDKTTTLSSSSAVSSRPQRKIKS